VTERSGAVEHPPYIVSCGGGTGLHYRPVSGNGGLLVVWFPWQGQDLVDGWQKRAGSWPRSSRNGRRQCACSAHRSRVSGRDLGSVSLNRDRDDATGWHGPLGGL